MSDLTLWPTARRSNHKQPNRAGMLLSVGAWIVGLLFVSGPVDDLNFHGEPDAATEPPNFTAADTRRLPVVLRVRSVARRSSTRSWRPVVSVLVLVLAFPQHTPCRSGRSSAGTDDVLFFLLSTVPPGRRRPAAICLLRRRCTCWTNIWLLSSSPVNLPDRDLDVALLPSPNSLRMPSGGRGRRRQADPPLRSSPVVMPGLASAALICLDSLERTALRPRAHRRHRVADPAPCPHRIRRHQPGPVPRQVRGLSGGLAAGPHRRDSRRRTNWSEVCPWCGSLMSGPIRPERGHPRRAPRRG